MVVVLLGRLQLSGGDQRLSCVRRSATSCAPESSTQTRVLTSRGVYGRGITKARLLGSLGKWSEDHKRILCDATRAARGFRHQTPRCVSREGALSC